MIQGKIDSKTKDKIKLFGKQSENNSLIELKTKKNSNLFFMFWLKRKSAVLLFI